MVKYLQIVVALLPVLAAWCSSYVWYGRLWCGTRHVGIIAESIRGDFQLRLETNSSGYTSNFIGADFDPAGPYENNYESRRWHWGGFGVGWNYPDPLYPQLRHSIVGSPYWFLAFISGVLAAIHWNKWRFSLRTLLIATTLLAVGLGLIVAAM